MTPAQTEMKALVASLRDDLQALTRLEQKLGQVVARMGAEPDPADVMAAAGYLHHIYTAVEAIGERILLPSAPWTGLRYQAMSGEG